MLIVAQLLRRVFSAQKFYLLARIVARLSNFNNLFQTTEYETVFDRHSIQVL
jgi:hypothetical protein